LDIISLAIYFIDILVHSQTAFKINDKWCSDKKLILKNFIVSGFFSDFLAFFPFEDVFYSVTRY